MIIQRKIAVVSVSGGKDSALTAARAIKRHGVESCRFVMSDNGNESDITMAYVRGPLQDFLGAPIEIIRPDFSDRIAAKRVYVAEKWPAKLTAGKVGKWVRLGVTKEAPPAMPEDPYSGAVAGGWVWSPGIRPQSAAKASEIVERALSALHPTGIPFLDLCLWKGRFPSRNAQFCTQELKRYPLDDFTLDLMAQGYSVESWQGVRRDESEARKDVLDVEMAAEGWLVVRPIAGMTALEVFAELKNIGCPINPLYLLGCSRVGCFPCINCSKDELLVISQRFPEVIDRIREWEKFVGMACKIGFSTLLHHADGEGGTAEHAYHHSNIDAMVDWAKTKRGGKQYDFLRTAPPPSCSSVYGLCE